MTPHLLTTMCDPFAIAYILCFPVPLLLMVSAAMFHVSVKGE